MRRWYVIALVVFLLGTLAVAGGYQINQTTQAEQPQRWQDAQARWRKAAPDTYEIAVEVEMRGQVCHQRVEVNTFGNERLLNDTCRSSWVGALSVPQIFDLIARVEELPSSRCSPSNTDCACHRVFTERVIEYDPELGYPLLLYSRSEVQPNWTHAQFWQALADQRSIPNCTPAERILSVKVLWMTPRS
jgi:hypothetical protein